LEYQRHRVKVRLGRLGSLEQKACLCILLAVDLHSIERQCCCPFGLNVSDKRRYAILPSARNYIKTSNVFVPRKKGLERVNRSRFSDVVGHAV